jgi:fructose-1,6-bisphosphatase/inositol monophosphatase family enzyme
LASEEVKTKENANDVVTAADVISEEIISSKLIDLLPGSVVVGEESVYKDKNLLSRLSDASPVWIVDPIDGTCNYANGDPNFAVIVALQIANETVAGWIYNPIENVMAVAEKGAGVWINGEKITIAPACNLSQMIGASFGHRDGNRGEEILRLEENIDTMVARGCGGNEFINIARGDIHFIIKENGILPWDYAAGVMMHQEAGGYSAMFDGSPYKTSENYENKGILLAPDKESWDNIFNCYIGKADADDLDADALDIDEDE